MCEIVIRHAEKTDVAAVHHLFTLPEVIRNTLQVPHPSLHMWEERMHPLPSDQRQLVACIDGRVVGHLAMHIPPRPRRSHTASFGICVDPAFGNRGVASALLNEMIDLCDNWLRVERIELTVFVDNAPAIAVYRKFGFEIEGTAKGYGLREGEYIDAYYMARLKAG